MEKLNLNFRALFLLVFISSCASKQLEYPLQHKKYKGDLVTVKTALDLAKQSYITSCLELSSKKKGRLSSCVKKADEHIKDNIVFILDQNGKDK